MVHHRWGSDMQNKRIATCKNKERGRRCTGPVCCSVQAEGVKRTCSRANELITRVNAVGLGGSGFIVWGPVAARLRGMACD